MVSAKGGMDIEEVAAEDPEALVQRHIDPTAPFDAAAARQIVDDAGIDEDVRDQVAEVLVEAGRGGARRGRDPDRGQPADRHRRPRGRRARREGDDRRQRALPPRGAGRARADAAEDPQEAMAKEKGLTYVKLDGNVGILGNGAGLCMSTLDVVAQAGGEPANFLDAGGGSKAEAIVDALEVITSDEKVTAILFNIFGGITRCDEIAKGIIEASRQIDIEVPLVVRLDGTNSEEGLGLLAEAEPAGPARGEDDARRGRAGRRAGGGSG